VHALGIQNISVFLLFEAAVFGTFICITIQCIFRKEDKIVEKKDESSESQ
jgi:hypothetical protein